MPLTPQTQLVLEARAGTPMACLETLSPEGARAAYAEVAARLPAPEDVARVEDRHVPGPAGDVPVRVYWPMEGATLAVVVYYHGGGWVIGDLDTHDGICRSLANASGQCVVSVDYRLAPEAPYPAAVEDCYAATEWVYRNAAELGVDAARLSVAGDSAGGNLAAVVCLAARGRSELPIRSQALIYPVTDYSFDTGSYRSKGGAQYGLGTEAMRWFWDNYLGSQDKGVESHASPLRAQDLSGLPPALIVTAEYDPLCDEGEAYGERLREAGVQATISRYNGVIHGFVGQAAFVPEGGQAIREVGAWLASA